MMNNENIILKWLVKKGWNQLPFQKEAWEKIHQGKDGLISVPTGAGKTYAAFLPALSMLHDNPGKGIHILYISPLKALAKDLEAALEQPILDLELPYRVEKRTGDTTTSQKNRQKKLPPEVLLTTPESLSLMLSQHDAIILFKNLQMIIVDEWHELLGTKRGVLLELCLARVKHLAPKVQIWALSATVGNLEEAAKICVGNDRTPVIVTANMAREVIVESVLPPSIEKLPWIGYLGLRMLPYVMDVLDPNKPTLIFTNTRSQAERWFQAIIEVKPEWEPLMALHHSSIDKARRMQIEEDIKSGRLSFVVCTSALDLGIDLPTVEKVIQIGSPKSIARLIQRAGRSIHRPFMPCHISLVPTHALQLLEMEGYKLALKQHIIESRYPLRNCYDVLLQHIVTCAIGGGIEKEEFFKEIRNTHCFSDLSKDVYEYCINFLMTGGKTFNAYSEFKKLVQEGELYVVKDPQMIRRHRMNIGTIISDSYVAIKLLKGKSLGTIEESFMSQLKIGDNFLFGGRKLKLVLYQDLTAHVRLTNDEDIQALHWSGTGLPFSSPLGHILRKVIENPQIYSENKLLREIFEIQHQKSYIPKESELLIEIIKSRSGWHLFVFPFEGKTIHDGLALLIAHRLSKVNPSTLVISCNDYGFELHSKKPFELGLLNSSLFNPLEAYQEFESIINIHEASKGTFREVAKISGLIFLGFPGKHKSNRQLQMSAGLLFEVLEKYDPENLLLRQAKKETLDKYFSQNNLYKVLERLHASNIVIKQPDKFTPFSLPLFIESVSERLSTETLIERIEQIQKSWAKKK